MTQKGDPFEGGLGPLFSPPIRALAGRTDPATSREAAAGKASTLGRDQRWVLDLVRGRPGSTCPELAKYATHSPGELMRQRIGRRLNEIEKAGLIHRDGVRDGCFVWWPTV